MKYWRLIIILALVIILGALVAFFLINPNTQTSSSSTPIENPFSDVSNSQTNLTSFTTSCYESYLKSYIAHSKQANPGQYDAYAQSCFTSNFINEWPTIISSTEGDPVLLSQDYYSSWLTTISAFVSSQSSTNATVIVSLGSGTQLEQLQVQLQNTSSGWRINSVSNSQ